MASLTSRGPIQAQSQVSELRQTSAKVFVFNPFTEGYLAHGRAFTPVKYQKLLLADLADLPQFLCADHDIVLVDNLPNRAFLQSLESAGFSPPRFVELKDGRLDPNLAIWQDSLGELRPWAWGPDSLELFRPLFPLISNSCRAPAQLFNPKIANLYSKGWSVNFLRKVLPQLRRGAAKLLLCSETELGTTVDSLDEALSSVAAIRERGHHRVVLKQTLGLAGHNAIRLWEPEILPQQKQWLANAFESGLQVVVEPWLKRVEDFSLQLEMEPGGLRLLGYTGLMNDVKGQYVGNWATANFAKKLPMQVTSLLQVPNLDDIYGPILSLLELELQRVGFMGPLNIDAFIYLTSDNNCQLKPIVEINPRYTMGRLTLELMKHVSPGSGGLFRLVNWSQAQAAGFSELSSFAQDLGRRIPLQLEGVPPKIRKGAICLNDPSRVQACLATFEVEPLAHC